MKLLRPASAALLLVLTSCFGLENVEKLRRAPAPPSPFAQELARLYLAFVDRELEKYDWDSAGYFAQKGLDTAHGKVIEPENPAQWDIPAYAMDELLSARASVMAKLNGGFAQVSPLDAAALVMGYDCWVEEQEEAWETAAIETCRQNVLRYMSELDRPIDTAAPLSTSYLFHFPLDQAELDGLARDELAVIASAVSAQSGPYEIIINGNVDRLGSDDASVTLSAVRAEYIRDFLQRRGVPVDAIRYHPYGDTPLPESGSNGRRIEIFIE